MAVTNTALATQLENVRIELKGDIQEAKNAAKDNNRTLRGSNGDIGLVAEVDKNTEHRLKVESWIVWASRFMIAQSIAVVIAVLYYVFGL